MLAASHTAFDQFIAWFGYDRISFWIVLTAVLVNISCAVLGCFLVLRRMSMLGDAIAHAILPGIAIGFMVSGSRAMLPMLVGALVIGVLTAVLTQTIHRFARVPEDAAMGVVFTSLFAVGVVMIHQYAKTDLDPDCVLHGVLVTASKNTVEIFDMRISRPALTMAIVCAVVLLYVIVFWKELKIVSFDPGAALAQGINAHLVHYSLMGMVALVTVTAFEAVGSILVVAMLIVPGATAVLLTRRLWTMVLLAATVGSAAAVLGANMAARLETDTPGMISVVAGALFVAAVIFAPEQGVVMKLIRQGALSLRIVQEDVLALLYRCREVTAHGALEQRKVSAALGGGALPALAIWNLRRRGAVRLDAEQRLALSDAGATEAQTLVKTHRLWESYLEKVLGFAPDHVHASADRAEHYISARIQKEVADETDHPATDPHGRPIPGVRE